MVQIVIFRADDYEFQAMHLTGKRLTDIIKNNPVCIHCGARVFPNAAGRKPTKPRPVVEHAQNAIGEDIAWCDCPKCGKVTPLMM